MPRIQFSNVSGCEGETFDFSVEANTNEVIWYADSGLVKWRKYLKQGIEDWQKAFEAAGFKNAIIAKDPPSKEEDPDWSPEDVRYSVVRYLGRRLLSMKSSTCRVVKCGQPQIRCISPSTKIAFTNTKYARLTHSVTFESPRTSKISESERVKSSNSISKVVINKPDEQGAELGIQEELDYFCLVNKVFKTSLVSFAPTEL